ncbi:hypothetical protein PZH39_16545 [Desulfovibrio desulfuricans]|nr:hypothetical protein [Desulfovibrio desulfuricans]MDE8731295.1 hypothetical protein [Desulfovibrio desulfuricans]
MKFGVRLDTALALGADKLYGSVAV